MLALCLAGCEGGTVSGNGNLYIEVLPDASALYCVKFLSPGADAANGANVFSKYLRIETIGSKKFYVYQAPRKELDIYTENTRSGGYAGRNNDRVRVNLKINDWAKLISDSGPYAVIGDWSLRDGSGPIY